VDGVIKPEVKDLRACPEVGGTVMFPADSNPYPFGIDPYWHGTKVSCGDGQAVVWRPCCARSHVDASLYDCEAVACLGSLAETLDTRKRGM
jgi:hypothetical protein